MGSNRTRAILLPDDIQMAYSDQALAIAEAIDVLLDVGGQHVMLRKAPIVDSYRTYDVPDYIEAKVYIGQVLEQDYVWVEVEVAALEET